MFLFVILVLQRPLTFLDLVLIAKRLTSPGRVRTLGAQLGLQDYEVEIKLSDNRNDINNAASQVLYAFRRTVADDTEAFVLLWEGLLRAGLVNVAWDVLGKESH